MQAAEANFDEVHANMDDSTQPLLRQIEVLQAKINELMKSRDEVERRYGRLQVLLHSKATILMLIYLLLMASFMVQLEETKSSLAQSAANEAQLEKSVADYVSSRVIPDICHNVAC